MYKNNNLKLLGWIGGALVVLVILLIVMKPVERYYLENHKDYSSYELDFNGENLLLLLAKAPVLEEIPNEDETDALFTFDPTFFDSYVPEDVQVINVTSNSKYIIVQYYRGNDFVNLGYENNKLIEISIQNETKGLVTYIYNGEVTISDL